MKAIAIFAAAALMSAPAFADTSVAGYQPSAKPTWVLVTPGTISAFSAVQPLLFETEADCRDAAAQMSKGIKCIRVIVWR